MLRLECDQFVHQVHALFRDLPGQIVLYRVLDGGDGSRARQRIATKCGRAQNPGVVFQLVYPQMRSGRDTCDRHDTTAKRLAEGEDVGHHIVGFAGPERAGAAHAGLYLVQDEEDVVPVTDLTQLGQVVVGGYDDAGLALDGFDDNSRN